MIFDKTKKMRLLGKTSYQSVGLHTYLKVTEIKKMGKSCLVAGTIMIYNQNKQSALFYQLIWISNWPTACCPCGKHTFFSFLPSQWWNDFPATLWTAKSLLIDHLCKQNIGSWYTLFPPTSSVTSWSPKASSSVFPVPEFVLVFFWYWRKNIQITERTKKQWELYEGFSWKGFWKASEFLISALCHHLLLPNIHATFSLETILTLSLFSLVLDRAPKL